MSRNQLKIIAGKYGSRLINAPKGQKTHPMGERVRGALFSALGGIDSLKILDPFAGSGAVAFEAASRGAKKVVAIEIDSRAFAVLTANQKLLNCVEVEVVRANCISWLKNNPERDFDIIVADPPYDNFDPTMFGQLGQALKIGGLLVISHPFSVDLKAVAGLSFVMRRDYGRASLSYYRRLEE